MKPHNVCIRFDLDRDEDRAALAWLSRSKSAGFKTNSAAVIAAINEYASRRERLASDPYLETREKEDAFLQEILDTIRQGMRESGAASFGGLLAALQGAASVPGNAAPNGGEGAEPVDDESLNTAFDFVDSL